MLAFHALPIPTEAADAVWTRPIDSYGNPLTPRLVQSRPGSPCRHCLTEIAVGESCYALAYSPFATPGPFSEVGPILLHAARCAAFEPAAGRVPEVIRARTVAIRGYNAAHEIEAADLAEGTAAESLIERLLADPSVAYLHARTARYGCFLCRIERA